MKLKSDFISHDVDDARYLVPTGGKEYEGLARGNKTAAFILDLLQTETTEAEIVDAMCARYNAPRELIAADVARILATLREMSAIEE